MRPFAQSFALGAATVCALTACGEADSDGSGGSASDPIKVMTIGQFQAQAFAFPDMAKAVEKVIDDANEDGGINGRQIELITCNDEGDTNVAGRCARQAVTEGVVAVIGTISLYAPAIVPLLEAADIPYLGALPILPEDSDSPISYPLDAGNTAATSGIGIALVKSGCSNVGILNTADAGGDATAGYMTAGIEFAGGKVVKTVSVPTTAVDYSAPVQELIDSGVECLGLGLPPANAANAIGAIRQSPKPDLQLAIATATLPSESRAALGAGAEGIIVLQQTLLPGEETPTLIEQLSDVIPSGSEITTPVVGAWAAATAFVKVASEIDGEVTNTSMIEQLGKTSALELEPYPEPIDITEENPAEGNSRLFNTLTLPYRVVSGGELEFAEDIGVIDVQDALP
jgi:ABC-type branched-subunit amino acid transport system substrate-binding protein